MAPIQATVLIFVEYWRLSSFVRSSHSKIFRHWQNRDWHGVDGPMSADGTCDSRAFPLYADGFRHQRSTVWDGDGLAGQLVFTGVEIAGQLIDFQVGFSMAQSL